MNSLNPLPLILKTFFQPSLILIHTLIRSCLEDCNLIDLRLHQPHLIHRKISKQTIILLVSGYQAIT